MLAKRIIPCLDIKDGQTVKGINFLGLKDVGDPVELGRRYAEQGADELVYLDISATQEGRRTFAELVTRIAERINIPFTVGGGIASVEDAGRLLAAGADKVTVNSAAVRNPELISDIASKYGSQFVVVAIDAKQVDGRWRVTTHGGRRLHRPGAFLLGRRGATARSGRDSVHVDGPRRDEKRLPVRHLRPAVGAVVDSRHRLGRGRIGAAHRRCADARKSRRRTGSQHFSLRRNTHPIA